MLAQNDYLRFRHRSYHWSMDMSLIAGNLGVVQRLLDADSVRLFLEDAHKGFAIVEG